MSGEKVILVKKGESKKWKVEIESKGESEEGQVGILPPAPTFYFLLFTFSDDPSDLRFCTGEPVPELLLEDLLGNRQIEVAVRVAHA